MGLLDDVETLLNQAGVDVAPWVIKKTELTDGAGEVDTQIGVFRGPGSPPETVAEVEYPGIQVIVRGPKRSEGGTPYKDAESKAGDVKDALHAVDKQTVGGTVYVGITQQGDMIPLGEDANDRPQISLNFEVTREA